MKNVHSAQYIAALLFFGYMAVVSFLFFVLTGPQHHFVTPYYTPLIFRIRRFLWFHSHFLFRAHYFRCRKIGLMTSSKTKTNKYHVRTLTVYEVIVRRTGKSFTIKR